ncbi:hypothetical protein [Xanthobacter oligotrophicus]|uniref:Uncharacterized protein n=1 Tax=Xanthobacter oligotrophicus TaxID=2607286 RepID=A0ABW6ZZ39_9HYPH|nr:hypothetical protein [Xanthobacter oligotrophicus]MCG5236821.1 hypothetical protein [Xanthobacter oligotrophicus]
MADKTSSRRIALLAFAAGAGVALASSGLIQGALANQPNMWRAMGALQNARAALMEAEPNKGGHRERAIELVDKAIEETRAGIEFAR